jgi:hypothetical protein
VILWAERPELYARAGFAPGPYEQTLALARRPHRDRADVRLAGIADHRALHDLHERKPWRVQRTPAAMLALLTTPGMSTFVLEDGGRIRAYACCGKGADLQGVWHEVGGDDGDIAILLPAALALLEQRTALFLLPPYRPALAAALAPWTRRGLARRSDAGLVAPGGGTPVLRRRARFGLTGGRTEPATGSVVRTGLRNWMAGLGAVP